MPNDVGFRTIQCRSCRRLLLYERAARATGRAGRAGSA
ncbi:hypothetical protein FCH79_11495 [Pseudomonas koreensis]|nr:hypothetical protein [Pseudomonas koreensis]